MECLDFWIFCSTSRHITSHYIRVIYSGLLKYMTAKPLVYTVYRTRNRKLLERKWSGKEMSFEADPFQDASRPIFFNFTIKCTQNPSGMGYLCTVKHVIRKIKLKIFSDDRTPDPFPSVEGKTFPHPIPVPQSSCLQHSCWAAFLSTQGGNHNSNVGHIHFWKQVLSTIWAHCSTAAVVGLSARKVLKFSAKQHNLRPREPSKCLQFSD